MNFRRGGPDPIIALLKNVLDLNTERQELVLLPQLYKSVAYMYILYVCNIYNVYIEIYVAFISFEFLTTYTNEHLISIRICPECIIIHLWRLYIILLIYIRKTGLRLQGVAPAFFSLALLSMLLFPLTVAYLSRLKLKP